MNYYGSYRRLLGNAKAAMLAAIEIYNKPTFEYRDECFVILLLNAWELVLKALLSKNHQSIYYPKKRKQPYRTLSWGDASAKSQPLFPNGLPTLPMRKNLDFLSRYRDNATHFYNKPGFGSVIYALAQTSIVNFKDLVWSAFSLDLASEITWQLLPLGLKAPIDPIEYISPTHISKEKKGAVQEFISELAKATQEVQEAGLDTGRLLTVFAVKLESTKKIDTADVIVGLQTNDVPSDAQVIAKTIDPNVTHPLRRKDILEQLPTLHGRQLTSHVFEATAWKYRLKEKPYICWQSEQGSLTKYSRDIISLIRRLDPEEIDAAVIDYKRWLRTRRKQAGAHQPADLDPDG